MVNREYLGDGVYVSVQWGDIKLETERGGEIHFIVLEPQVYAALVAYVKGQRLKDDAAADANAEGR